MLLFGGVPDLTVPFPNHPEVELDAVLDEDLR
jgi:hypothetical protein